MKDGGVDTDNRTDTTRKPKQLLGCIGAPGAPGRNRTAGKKTRADHTRSPGLTALHHYSVTCRRRLTHRERPADFWKFSSPSLTKVSLVIFFRYSNGTRFFFFGSSFDAFHHSNKYSFEKKQEDDK